ncbi:MAG: hypothetical protein JSV63_03970 [Candidatus Aenigmatarchaeota archaeon]|nr:MAG: hypothetical protein JSV63_03970 [Candidatus Aenigmarchaeota archaeon]
MIYLEGHRRFYVAVNGEDYFSDGAGNIVGFPTEDLASLFANGNDGKMYRAELMDSEELKKKTGRKVTLWDAAFLPGDSMD